MLHRAFASRVIGWFLRSFVSVEPLSSRTLTWVTNIAHDPFVEDEERTRRGRGELQSLQLHGLCRRDECIDKLHRVKLQRRMQRLQRELEEQTK